MSLVNSLSKKRLDITKEKKSLLCAGLDPALFQMGRGEKGLPESVTTHEQLYDRSKAYIDAVAPYVSGLKVNVKYREGEGQGSVLRKLYEYAKDLGLFLVEDGKIADIGSTNDASLYYSSQRSPDAVTIAPYAGNMKGTIDDSTKRGMGSFTMCLMSSPAYAKEKYLLVPVSPEEQHQYDEKDLILMENSRYVHRYISLTHQSRMYGALGVVIGAPSSSNHLSEEEIETVARYLGEDQLILCPGTGAQGGDPSVLIKYFGSRVMVCMSRGLMFPKGSHSTSKEQEEIANKWSTSIGQNI